MNEILLPRRRSWGPWIRDSLKLHKTQWLLPENPFSPHSFRNWPGLTQHSLGASSHLAAPSTHIPVTEKVEMVQGSVLPVYHPSPLGLLGVCFCVCYSLVK